LTSFHLYKLNAANKTFTSTSFSLFFFYLTGRKNACVLDNQRSKSVHLLLFFFMLLSRRISTMKTNNHIYDSGRKKNVREIIAIEHFWQKTYAHPSQGLTRISFHSFLLSNIWVEHIISIIYFCSSSMLTLSSNKQTRNYIIDSIMRV
jgi:hypothetical protein